jgi:hypothetical protein
MSFNLLYNLLQRQDSRSSMTPQELANVDAGRLPIGMSSELRSPVYGFASPDEPLSAACQKLWNTIFEQCLEDRNQSQRSEIQSL